MFSEKQTQYFIYLCSSGSFSRTAEKYKVSRQVISKSIASMEEQLGLRLFDRRGRQALLTRAGVMLHEFLIDEKVRFDILKEQFDNLMSRDAGSLIIGFHDFMPVGTDMQGFLQSANQKYGVTIELKRYPPATLYKRLVSKRLDMIVVSERYLINIEQFSVLRLGERSTFLIVSARHPKASPDATWADFKNEPLIAEILDGETKAEFVTRIQKEISAYGFMPVEIIDEPNWDSAYMNVRMGRGVMISGESSRFFNTNTTHVYDTGSKEAILCIWRKGEHEKNIAELARFLKKVTGGDAVDFRE